MVAKALFVLCSSAFLVQTISSQCLGNAGLIGFGNGLAGINSGLGWAGGCGAASTINNAAARGGAFGVSSYSPIAPSGISVVSENAIEGILDVNGQLPLLAAVALEGQVPSSGAAGVNYGCGNGNIGIVNEGLGYGGGFGAGYGAGYGAGPLLAAGPLAGAPLSLASCGCNGIY